MNNKEINALTQTYFKIDSKPAILTSGELEIFNSVVQREPDRVAVRAYTQYGKSLTIALALIVRLTAYPEKWIIVAGTQKQGRVIGGYVLHHLFDSAVWYKQLEITDSLERLKRERSKDHLTFKRGGELLILTADVRNKQRAGEALMEFGAPNVVIDGSGLLDDDVYATAKRMIGGTKDHFLIEAGNPFRRNHFLRSCNDPHYKQIHIKGEQGVEEGRITQEFLDEMRAEAFYSILYDCEFPEQDQEGLLAIEILQEASEQEAITEGLSAMGIDVASGGGDLSVITIVRGEKQTRQDIYNTNDVMELVGYAHNIQSQEKVDIIGIDVVGIGNGVYARLNEKNKDSTDSFKVKHLIPVNFGAGAIEEPRPEFPGFANIRAEAYIELKYLIENTKGSFLSPYSDMDLWQQIVAHNISYDSKRRYKIPPKEEVKKKLRGKSPDKADGLAIACWARKKVLYKKQSSGVSMAVVGGEEEGEEED